MIGLAAMVIGPIELAMPAWLWLLVPVWALVILIGRKSLSAVGSGSRRMALFARLLVVLLVVMTLAEPSWREESDKLAVTAVIDMSKSVPTRMQSIAEEYVEAAAAAFAEHALALSRPRPIRITAFTSNFSPRATRIFSAFSVLHPEVQLEFLRSAAYLDLKKGEADIALRLTRNPQDPDLICRKIITARFTILPPFMFRARPRPRSLAAKASAPMRASSRA